MAVNTELTRRSAAFDMDHFLSSSESQTINLTSADRYRYQVETTVVAQMIY